jgi:arylsulfatase A-like enzyme
MEPVPAETPKDHPPRLARLSPRGALQFAAWFGLLGGYLDLAGMFLRRKYWDQDLYYWEGRDFPWTVPLANLALVMAPGLLVAVANRLRPGLVPLRFAAWVFATVALWGPLLRMPVSGTASLLLAAGLARWASRGTAAYAPRFPRLARASLGALIGVLAALAAASSGRHAVREWLALSRLPAPPAGAANVLLVVMDTVRARSLGLHGYPRDTSPNLARWARKGVRFDLALAPATWTFPAHACLFTGRWPSETNSLLNHVIDAPVPTLAEFLGSRGFLTAGFVANTTFCSYESGLDRGFAHFEDYPLSPWTALSRTAAGRWLAQSTLSPGDSYGRKWLRFQSRDARGINRAFLDWLSRRPRGRPFFAFLNYFDAHEPFVPPPGHARRFGLRPESPRDDLFLREYWRVDKRALSPRDVALARDSYDECIAALDLQVGALLDELDRRGVLRDTVVIITSDHGEEFGEHGVFDHGYSLYLDAIHVPLLIVSPSTPHGRAVSEPVSLRDLPATVVDLTGLTAGSPFPGRSLAAHWGSAPGPDRPTTTPALSELANLTPLKPQHGPGPTQQGLAMSLVAEGRHYIRDIARTEELYDLTSDPREWHNLANVEAEPALSPYRKSLLQILTAVPLTKANDWGPLRGYKRVLESQVRGQPPSLTPRPYGAPAPGGFRFTPSAFTPLPKRDDASLRGSGSKAPGPPRAGHGSGS